MIDHRVAVLLSAYNGEHFIKEQIQSIFAQQDMRNLTLIVRDDGSTDSTPVILEELQTHHPNMTILNGANIGLVASFFELLQYACRQGFDFYSFSDQDDYWLPDKLYTAVTTLLSFDTPAMYASCSRIVDDDLVESGSLTQMKLRDITFYNSAIQNFCPGHNQVLNRVLAEMVVAKTVVSPAVYSQDLWIANVAAVAGTIIFDNTPHTLYRQHRNNQLSYGKGRMEWVKDHLKRLKKGEGKKIARQLRYFLQCYGDCLDQEQQHEITLFFGSQNSFLKRLSYIVRSKLYRQRCWETPLFKMIYLFGGYADKA